ncbi:MAG: FecR family protein [Bacteroidota bacterium]
MKSNRDVLLAKWLNNELNPEELQLLEQEVDLAALRKVLQRQQAFDMELQPVDPMWQALQTQLAAAPSPNRHRWLWWAGALFLVLALVLFLFFYFQNTDLQQIQAPPGQKEKIIYADGSQVDISPGSNLTYLEADWEHTRRVDLEGQAFFDITEGKPFTVYTHRAKIEVLGTRFDVRSIGDQLRVQCFSGKVRVSYPSNNQSAILTAQQQVHLRQQQLTKVDTLGFAQADWLQEVSVYQRIPVRHIIHDIERFYAVKIDASAVATDGYFSGIIPLNDLDKALDYLSKTMRWQYRQTPEQIILES